MHLGAGNDTLSIRVDEVISVKGGRGDDVIAVGGGTVALHFEAGDGNDRISVARGATLAIQPEGKIDWNASWEGDTLVLDLGGSSMRIEGAKGAAAIGVMRLVSIDLTILHIGPVLDRTA